MIAVRALVIIAIAACAPSVPTGSGPDAAPVPRHVTGRVWMPNSAPGQAAPGEEIPVYGATVYLSLTRPDPIPQNVYCEQCSQIPTGAQSSGHDGSFDVVGSSGVWWLVIQKGQFRVEQEIDLTRGDLALAPAATTLPSVNDPAHGMWMPKIAIALGTNDHIEDVLGKLGLGDYDPATYTFTGGGTEISVFDDPSTLLGDLDLLRQFHIVFFPCNVYVDDYTIPGMDDQTQLDNLRHYVAEGGKLYVTDWSGDMIDHAFPPQIELGDPGADTTGTYDPQAFGGSLATIGDSDGTLYDATDAQVVDPDLAGWLGLQTGPTPGDPTPQLFDPSSFAATDNWNWIKSLTSVQVGTDDQGLPIYDDPKPWVVGSGPSTGGVKQPLTVTFQPTGCGRVMFSTYQTANGHHPGLYPQERILLYLIMEIEECSNVPVVH